MFSPLHVLPNLILKSRYVLSFQGYMSDTEASSILSSLGTGSWMFVLHKTQLTPYLLWATSDGIERGRIIFNSDSTYAYTLL